MLRGDSYPGQVFNWEGPVDANGDACGEGFGTATIFGDVVMVTGTFWKGEPYGIVTTSDDTGNAETNEFNYGGDGA